MRIAVLLDRWHAEGGGLEQYLRHVLPLLVRRGHGVLLLAHGASHGTPWGVSAQDLRRGRLLPRPWSDWQEAREALRLARNWQAEVYWGLRAIPCPGALWQPMGGSSPDVQKARHRHQSRRARSLQRLEEETLRTAACVIPMSPMVARQIQQRAPQQRQQVLPLPLLVPPENLRQPSKHLRGKLGDPLHVLFCGRDPVRHGAAAAVSWFRCLKTRGVVAKMDLWSKTVVHSERALGKTAPSLRKESIFLHPWDGGFRSALASADLLFHPTLYDSFSLVCLEAAAAGVPVVTTRDAGVAEMLPPELCARVARDYPEAAAGQAMALWLGAGRMAAEDWRSMVQGVRDGFCLEEHLRQLEAVLASLLNEEDVTI